MKDKPQSYRLSPECLDQLRMIKVENGLSSITAAIEFSASAYSGTKELLAALGTADHKMSNINKSINELRRNDYLILALLNAISVEMDISNVPPHHDSKFRSPALSSAHENIQGFLADVMTKIRGGVKDDGDVIDG